MLKFCFDQMSAPGVLGYPNLAKSGLAPDQFDDTWPRCIPCRLFVYFKRHGIGVEQYHIDDAPPGSWYPVGIAWHDFDCDYFSLCSPKVISKIKDKSIKILFYYHEGDNPFEIKKRMDFLLEKHNLPMDCYLFVSANSKANEIKNFYYFSDHEYFFHYVNRNQTCPEISERHRKYRFTALSRSHKWWRASIMSDLVESGLLNQSLWSYNTSIDVGDLESENPLEVDLFDGWREKIQRFVGQGPYFCDSEDHDSHNDHRRVEAYLYNDSYCNLILETHFDADGSHGSFITEKTYKCFKFGQPFVMIGPPGTLSTLREHGYRVFDSQIDNRYDEIINNTQRWAHIKKTITELAQKDLHKWFLECLPDIRHNRELFLSGNRKNLMDLVDHLNINK